MQRNRVIRMLSSIQKPAIEKKKRARLVEVSTNVVDNNNNIIITNDDDDNNRMNYVKNWLSTIPSINESTEVEILQNELEFNHDQMYDNIASINSDVYDCIVINVPPDNNYNNNNNIVSVDNTNKDPIIDNNDDLINNNIINITDEESQGLIIEEYVFNPTNNTNIKNSTSVEISDDKLNEPTEASTIGENGYRVKKRINQRKTNSLLRISGKPYYSRKGDMVKNKSIQPNPCSSMKCQNKCGSISEISRKQIFDSYYALNSQQQKDFLVSSIKTESVKRRYTDNDITKKSCTKLYYLPVHGELRKVCQQFVLKTLDISQTVLRYTDGNKNNILNISKSERRGKKRPWNKTKDDNVMGVEHFIKKLPAIPSHYCRGSTVKKYLPPDHKNISAVYRTYKTECLKSTPEQCPVTEKVFRNIFSNKFNIGFHTPKKDKCGTCEKFKNLDGEILSEEQKTKINTHKKNAEFSKAIHLTEQEKAKKDKSFICTSFDMQKILNTPHGDSILLYYSRKYAMYNETYYESGTKNGYCFIWGEENGQRGANEICTTMSKYLTIVDERSYVQSVSLFCDSCPGQNKNNQLLASLFWFMQTKSKNIKFLSITYLQPGHTYMPVDSVHSTIESNLKKSIIWAPSEWPTVIVNSRFNPKPYEVIKLCHNDFMDYKTLQMNIFPKLTSTDDGKKIKISEVKRVLFTKNSPTLSLQFSYDPESEKNEVTIAQPKRRKGAKAHNYVGFENSELHPLYKKKLPISTAKYKDLEKLCHDGVIPTRYQQEFLSMNKKETVPDDLGETDEEDETLERYLLQD